jgi:hypothetical protein
MSVGRPFVAEQHAGEEAVVGKVKKREDGLSDICDEDVGDECKGGVEIYDCSGVDGAVAEFCEASEGAGG